MGGGETSIGEEEFKTNIDTILHVLETFQAQMEDPAASSALVTPSPAEFWRAHAAILQSLARECTKIAMAYSQPPPPKGKDAAQLLNGLEQTIVYFFSAFFNLRPAVEAGEFGRIAWNRLRASTKAISAALANFVRLIGRGSPDEVKATLLHSTGGVWELCDRAAELPRSNADAALLDVAENLRLVEDALREVAEARTEEVADRTLLAGLGGLVSTTKATLRKLRACFAAAKAAEKGEKEVEVVSYTMAALVPACDEAVSAVYFEAGGVLAGAEALGAALRDMHHRMAEAGEAGAFGEAHDPERLAFLAKATQHNLDKLREVDLSKGMEGLAAGE